MNGIQIATSVLEPAAQSIDGVSFMFGKRWESALASIKESTGKWIHIESAYQESVDLRTMTSTVTFSGLIVTQDRVDSAPTTSRKRGTNPNNVPRETLLTDMWNLYIDFLAAVRATRGIQVTRFEGIPAIQVLNVMTGYIVNFTIVTRHNDC